MLDQIYLTNHLLSLVKLYDKSSAVSAAITKNNNFIWNEEVYTRDSKIFLTCKDWAEFFSTLASSARKESFNINKVNQIFGSDREYDRLADLTHGITIDVPAKFKSSGPPQKFRKLQTMLTKTYSCLYQKLWSKKQGVILRVADIPPVWLKKLHFMDSHWTPKPDSVDGRILIDNSNGNTNSILNTPEVKAKGIERYGKVILPNILGVLNSWIRFASSENVTLSDCLMWSDDIDGAFPQLRIRPDNSRYMATMVDSEMLFIYTNGPFGHTNMPAAFGTVSRAINRAINNDISGVCSVYCDDFIGISLKTAASSDKATAQSITRKTFNNSAVSEKKSKGPSTEADFVG